MVKSFRLKNLSAIWLYYIENILVPKLIQTAKTMRTVEVETTQFMQEKKQKILSMFLNENRRQAKLLLM